MSCPTCQSPTTPTARFCPRCGTALPASAPPPPASPPTIVPQPSAPHPAGPPLPAGPQSPPSTWPTSPAAPFSPASAAPPPPHQGYPPSPHAPIQVRSDEFRTQAQLASRDAAGVLSTLSRGPVAGMVQAYSNVGPGRAMGAGIALLGLFVLTMLFAYGRLVSGFGDFGGGLTSVGAYVKVAFVSIVPAGGAVLVSLIGRKISGEGGSLGGDVFIAGCALIPFAVWLLSVFVLGAANAEVIVGLGVFALCYFTLLMYNGLTRIGRLSADMAALLVPAAILVMGYLTSVAVRSLVSNALGGLF